MKEKEEESRKRMHRFFTNDPKVRKDIPKKDKLEKRRKTPIFYFGHLETQFLILEVEYKIKEYQKFLSLQNNK